MESKNTLSEMLERLKQERDELRVKVHLAKMDAEDEWRDIEERWEDLERRAADIADKTKETSASFLAASESLGAEIGEAFRRFRDRL